MGREKRRYRRLDTDLEARVKNLSEPGSDPIDVRIVNLGPEGAFLQADDLYKVQSQIALDFRIDSYPKEINVIAKVLWIKKKEEERGKEELVDDRLHDPHRGDRSHEEDNRHGGGGDLGCIKTESEHGGSLGRSTASTLELDERSANQHVHRSSDHRPAAGRPG